MINPEDVTIIVPHLGASPEMEYSFQETLTSLEETVPDIRIIVVKNGAVPCKHGDIIIKEQGQCKAVNAAVATVNTPWIFVTNDDMIYAPGWWSDLNTTIYDFNKPEKEMCLSPKLIEPIDGAPTFERQMFGGAGGDFNKELWLEFANNKSQGTMRTGFNLPFLIKKELWDLIGGYDINFDPWGSNGDSDLEYKIKLAGIQPYQNTNCIVYHFSQTSGTFEPKNQNYWQKNWDYFIQKWGFRRTDDGIWEANFIIPDEGRKYRPDYEGKYADH